MFNTKGLLNAVCLALYCSSALAAFNVNSKNNVAVYYGQGPDQKPLAMYCADKSIDIIILSFIHLFPAQANGYPGLNLGNQCSDETYPGPGYGGKNDPSKNQLLKCPNIQRDLNYCRAKYPSKKILLSLGGGTNGYQLTGASDGTNLATQLWNLFGPRQQSLVNRGIPRPFDYNNIGFSVDGFDLDIEHPSTDKSAGYKALVTELKRLFGTANSQFYLTASPQCVVPDANMKDMLSTVAFDLVFIQFYNTWRCSARRWIVENPLYQPGGPVAWAGFTYGNWTNWLANTPSKNARLFLSLPGSAAAANKGYEVTLRGENSITNAYYCRPNFGGISVWDATGMSRKLDSAMGAIKFEWIHSSSDDINKEHDAEKRKAVRVQAMKAAAASRKKTGTWGKQNMRQPEVVRLYSNDKATSASASHKEASRNSVRARDMLRPTNHVIPIIRYLNSDGRSATIHLGTQATSQFEQSNGRIGRPMPLPGFEHLSVDVGVNVLDLDELTCVATGQVAGSLLAQHHTTLDKLIVRRRQSYLFHIPASNKGETDTAAGQCHRKCLQAAVNDANDWTDPHTLGAVEILSICELLESPARPSAWEKHIAGAGRLIRARGPSRFGTEFEKALLTSMIAPLICEAMRLRQPCFLGEEPWQAVLRSLAIDGAHHYHPRGLGYIRLWAHGARLPGLVLDMCNATANPQAFTDDQIDDLERRCRAFKNGLLACMVEYDKHEPCGDGDVHVELLGATYAMLASASRLLGAISPSERLFQEEEAVRYAKEMRKLVLDIINADKWASFYLEQKIVVADSVLSTTDLWLKGLDKTTPPRRTSGKARLIEKWKFHTWCAGIPDDYGLQYDPRLGYRNRDITVTWNDTAEVVTA
ncbi:Endochitinase A1 [Seiridium cupressi]